MQNKHITHLEDLPLEMGSLGVKEILSYLDQVFKQIQNDTSDSAVDVSIKFDGAPAFFYGLDPEDNRPFISTKSIFNKTPKFYKSVEEIEEAFPESKQLAEKLSILLTELSKGTIKPHVMVQGDLMYTKSDLEVENIEGKTFVTFQPNSIVYAFEAKSPEAKAIVNSTVGICLHTLYTIGDNIKEIKTTTFSKDALSVPASVFSFSKYYGDASGILLLDKSESDEFESLLSDLNVVSDRLDASLIDKISETELIKKSLMAYVNFLVKQKQSIENISVELVQKYLNQQKSIATKYWPEILEFVENNLSELKVLFSFMNITQSIKDVLIGFMNRSVNKWETFLKLSSGGHEKTSNEGFVAYKNDNSGIIKFVNRANFSATNFNVDDKYTKGF